MKTQRYSTAPVEVQNTPCHAAPGGLILFTGLDVHNDSIAVSIAPSDSIGVRRLENHGKAVPWRNAGEGR